MYYILRLLNSQKHSRVDRIESNSLEDAVRFFMERKRMDKKTFDKLYYVEEDI
tara:strand:+ start:204 stop:362 length:159 start_codon:yes stop_codon:yes gene_type:complete